MNAESNETSSNCASSALLQTLNREEEKLAPVVPEPPLATNAVEEIIECTINTKPILRFVLDYFMGLEMNPVCDGCKSPTLDTDAQSEEHSSMVVYSFLCADFRVLSSEGGL